jgi:hypothetical protein
MKKVILVCAVLLFTAAGVSGAYAQTTDPATSGQMQGGGSDVSAMLDKELALTAEQKPKISKWVADYSAKIGAATDAKKKDMLFTEFSDGLKKTVTKEQAARYDAVKGKVREALVGMKP